MRRSAPRARLAQWIDGKLTVWSHTQGVFPLRGDLAKALALPAASIVVIHREGAGCYGQNGADDVALDAALLARATKGRPVKLQWMRDDEFAWEPYGSAMAMRMSAVWMPPEACATGSTKSGAMRTACVPAIRTAATCWRPWHLEKPLAAGPGRNIPTALRRSDRNAVPLYGFPQQKIVNHLLPEMPLRVSALRTLARTRTSSRWNRSWTSSPPRRAPTRSRFACATLPTREPGLLSRRWRRWPPGSRAKRAMAGADEGSRSRNTRTSPYGAR
jgi:hypothetical protein